MIMSMAGRADAQTEAARVAAATRQAIAKKIATLVPKVEDDAGARVVLPRRGVCAPRLRAAESQCRLVGTARASELPSRTKTTTGGKA